MPPRRDQNGRRHPGGRPSTSWDTGGASRANRPNSREGQPAQPTGQLNPRGDQPQQRASRSDTRGGQPLRRETGQTNRPGGQPGWQGRGGQSRPRPHQRRQGGGDAEYRGGSGDPASRRDSTPRERVGPTMPGEPVRRKPPRHTVATLSGRPRGRPLCVEGALAEPAPTEPVPTGHQSPAALPGAYTSILFAARGSSGRLLAVPGADRPPGYPRGQPQTHRPIDEGGPPHLRRGGNTGPPPRSARPPGSGSSRHWRNLRKPEP
ncbi:unnamed protein product [Ixodes hexagonus]